MTLEQVLQFVEHPEKALAVGDIEDCIDWSTHWIHTLELELADDDFEVDTIHAELIKKHDRVNKAEAELKLTDQYRARAKKEILLKSLKSFRANIRKKRDRLLNFH